jgi:3-keto-disaccharide hydrolase
LKKLLLIAAALVAGTALAHDTGTMTGWRSIGGDDARQFWRGWKSEGFPVGWKVEGNTLSKEGEAEDLISRDRFGNFELELEWKLTPGGNAGIFYRGTREYDHIYWSAPEYQLLDDARHPDGRNRLTSAAADYALYAAPAGVVKPAGEWNRARIVVNGAHVEHWLNGRKVVSYELWSPDWKAKVAASKFAPYPNYGLAREGFIGIQGDHAGSLTVRNIRIRELR